MELLLLLLLLLLPGCAARENTALPVTLMAGEGYSCNVTTQWVEPGEDAVFLLTMEEGLAPTGSGPVLWKDGCAELTLHNVQRPRRIVPELTDSFCCITYEPNGGAGEAFTLAEDLRNHLRPNTDLGEGFSRPGHTLIGWNTAPDGSGKQISLGSRTEPENQILYAQWAQWNPDGDFETGAGFGLTITAFHGTGDTVVIPDTIGGKPVAAIGAGAFRNCEASRLVLPKTPIRIAEGAFQNCGFRECILFDSVEAISDAAFQGCPRLSTLRIQAAEAPAGYAQRKESLYADKAERLMQAKGHKKLIFYGGCSVWYNLDGAMAQEAFPEYTVINMGLNGLVNSELQLRILEALTEPGDIVFCTPEFASDSQMLRTAAMSRKDELLWCGLEYNYDLVSLVDFREIPYLLDSLSQYLGSREGSSTYRETYRDSRGRTYLDAFGSIPFLREQTMERLSDEVRLETEDIRPEAARRFAAWAERFREKGVGMYLGYACINADALPEKAPEDFDAFEEQYRQTLAAAGAPKLLGSLRRHCFPQNAFYDTNYHLRSREASQNTALWLEELTGAMKEDGLW